MRLGAGPNAQCSVPFDPRLLLSSTAPALYSDSDSDDDNIEGQHQLQITPLQLAAQADNGHMVCLLLDHGGDPLLRAASISRVLGHAYRETPITVAASHGKLAALQAILDWAAATRTNDELKTTARSYIATDTLLADAATKGQASAVQMLIDHGAPVEPIGEATGCTTALALALLAGSLSTVKILLDAGASPLTKDHKGWTAFDHAVQWATSREDHLEGDDLDILRLILDVRAATKRQDSNQWIFLVDRDVLSVLIDAGIPVDARFPLHTTALWAVTGETGPICSQQGKTSDDATVEVVRLLLDAGADINILARAGEGWPRYQSRTAPLIRAIQADFKGVVSLLLSRGADVFLHDHSTLSL